LPHIALYVLVYGRLEGGKRSGGGKYFEKLLRNRDLDLGLADRNMLRHLWRGMQRGRSIGICSFLGGRESRHPRASRRDRRLLFRRIFPSFH